MFFVLSRAWDKEKILSPHEESNLRPTDSAPRCTTTELQRGLMRSSHSVMFVNRMREIVSFEISKEIEKDFLFVPR